MKSDLTIWGDEKDKVKVKIATYSDGEYYVRIDLRTESIDNVSLYLNVKQARELQLKLLDVALNGKYSVKVKKGKK